MGRYFYMVLTVSFALFCLTDSCMLRVYVSYGMRCLISIHTVLTTERLLKKKKTHARVHMSTVIVVLCL